MNYPYRNRLFRFTGQLKPWTLLLCPILVSPLSIAQNDASAIYLRAGLGVGWSDDARFSDRDCGASAPPALFGCVTGNDGAPLSARGDFENSTQVELALGYRFDNIRLEGVLTHRGGMDFEGRANFLNVQGSQPVQADAANTSLMAMLYTDLPAIGQWQPYLGAGIGAGRNRLDPMTYRFPGLAPNALTVTPSGSHTNTTWQFSIGASRALSRNLEIDIAYRYTDLGDIETDAGTARIVRSGGTRDISIAGTRAEFQSQSVMSSLRYRF